MGWLSDFISWLSEFIEEHNIIFYIIYMLFTVCFTVWSFKSWIGSDEKLVHMQDVLFSNEYELEKGGTVIEYFKDLPEADYSIIIELLNKNDFYATYGLIKGDATKNVPLYVTEKWIKLLKPFVFQKDTLFEYTTSTDDDGSTSHFYTKVRHPFNYKHGDFTFLMITSSPLAKFSVYVIRYKVPFEEVEDMECLYFVYLFMVGLSFALIGFAVALTYSIIVKPSINWTSKRIKKFKKKFFPKNR